MDAWVLKPAFEYFVPRSLSKKDIKNGLNQKERPQPIILSITSFPERIDEAWISLAILLGQTVKPDKIILWLAKEQFHGAVLPDSLLRLKEKGVTIEFCDDIKSHKKYFYAIQRNPDALIITFDDDLYYDSYVVENLVKLHEQFPDCIAANRAHSIVYKDDRMLPYRKWKHNVTSKEPSYNLLHTSGAGTLFPPGVLHELAFRKDLLTDLSPRSDDVWLKIMSFLGSTKIVTNGRYNKDFVTVGTTQTESLVSTNTKLGGKDEQLRRVMEYFGIEVSDNNLKSGNNMNYRKSPE